MAQGYPEVTQLLNTSKKMGWTLAKYAPLPVACGHESDNYSSISSTRDHWQPN